LKLVELCNEQGKDAGKEKMEGLANSIDEIQRTSNELFLTKWLVDSSWNRIGTVKEKSLCFDSSWDGRYGVD